GSRHGRAGAHAPARGKRRGFSSVRADRPEAVRAVDRAVHPRSEGHLGLIAAGRAHDGEILPVRSVDRPLIASRTTDVLGVVAPLAGGPPAGSATGAALGIRGESLLRVVLLIGRGVDEVDSTVDAVDRPISVGHGAPPGRVGRVVRLRRAAASAVGKARGLASEAGPQRPRCRCGVPVAGRTGSLVRRRIQRVFESDIARPDRTISRHFVRAGGGFGTAFATSERQDVPRPDPCPHGAGERDNVPVTMAREHPGRRAGSHGGASLAPYPEWSTRTEIARPSPTNREDTNGCYASSIPRTSPSAPAMTTSASKRVPNENASSPRSSPRSIWPSPKRSIWS